VNSRFLKTVAIILNSTQFGEGHKLVRLYTESLGRTDASAFGARKTKSRFGSRLEPFTEGIVLLYRKGETSPYAIRDIDVTHHNDAIRGELDKFLIGTACIETVIRYVEREHHDFELFRVLSDTLQALNSVPSEKSVYLLSMYDIKFLSIMGYRPDMERCAKCSTLIQNSEVYSDSVSGFPLCKGCCISSSGPVETGALRFIEWAFNSSIPQAGKVTMQRTTLQQVRQIIEHLYLCTFQKVPESWHQLQTLV